MSSGPTAPRLADITISPETGELMRLALTHRSAVPDEAGVEKTNERLEHLGDSVLSLIITEELYQRHPTADEGELARMRSLVVSGASLAEQAATIGLGDVLILGANARQQGVAESRSVLADACEAVIGAIYLEHGFGAARRFVLELLAEDIELAEGRELDSKTALQELAAAFLKEHPVYRTVEVEGPTHKPRFTVVVEVAGRQLGRGQADSKKKAGQKAAAVALQRLRKESSGG